MQKIKSMIKKIGAISVGAAMLGATVTGALAAGLNDYPAPFVDTTARTYDYLMVLGADSKVDDTIGAIDIAAGLSATKVPGTSGGSGTVSVAGGVSEDIPLGSNIAEKNQLEKDITDSDVSSLLDGTVNFQGSDYDVSEHFELGVFNLNNVSVETGLTATDDDYADNVVMEVVTDAVKYYYAFDETVQVNKTKSSDALEIKFLGKTLKITTIDAANKFTATVGAEYYLQVGDTVTVEGKEVKLVDVGSGGSVIISVGGVQDVITADATKTINGVEIKNDDTFYTTKTDAKSASWLVAGGDAVETYLDGDAFIGEDTDDPTWIWDIGNLNSNAATTVSNAVTAEINASNSGPSLGIELDHNYRDGSDQDAIGIGECLDLPNNYLSICLDSLTVTGDDQYMSLTFELLEGIDLTSDSKVPGLANANVVHVKAGKDDGIKLLSSGAGLSNISANKDTKELWLTGDEVFYQDKDSRKKTFAGNATSGVAFGQLILDDTKSTNLQLNRTNTDLGHPSTNASATEIWTLNIEAIGDTTDDLAANVDSINTFWENGSRNIVNLGATKSSEEAGEVQWEGTNIGTKDENHRSRYGVIIEDPKSNGASDRVEFMIPSDQVQANVVIKGVAGAVSGGSGGTGSAISTYAGKGPGAVKDTEVSNPSDHNLILVGGPAVNRLSAQYLGLEYPAYGAASGLSAGEAMISLKTNADNVALVVAGWEGTDTQRAARVLGDYSAYTLTGNEVKVTGTTSSPTVVSSS